MSLRAVAMLGVASAFGREQPDCTSDISCKEVQASDLIFDCRFGGEGNTRGNVVLLHGFPEYATMYDDTMRALASQGYASMACDQRGYSPGASPADVESYNYDLLRDDVFNVAAAVGFNSFHLVGHDHGGILGWVVAASPEATGRVLSYASLSSPHPDALSKALVGTDIDQQQQCASQYFSMFVETDSASTHIGFWCNIFHLSPARPDCDQVQRGLYWYNGARAAGYMAIPPILSPWGMVGKGGACTAAAALRVSWGKGNGDSPKEGTPQSVAVGQIPVPSLFVCGSSDTSLLCNRPYAKASEDYCQAGFTYVEVDCGHGLLSCGKQDQTQKTIDSIVQHVKSASAALSV